MSDQPGNWEIYLSIGEFDKIRSDPRLAILLNLARIVNALTFCFRSLLQSTNDSTPAGQRHYFNSFLFACGILYEGLKVANTLGKHFGDRDSFQKGFGRLLKDKETKRLQETVLNSMRNKIVFHFEEGAMRTTLNELDLNSYLFAIGQGSTSGEAYYKLADDIAINFIIGSPGTHEDEVQLFRTTAKGITQILSGFVAAANDVIADILKEMNWVVREVPEKS